MNHYSKNPSSDRYF